MTGIEGLPLTDMRLIGALLLGVVLAYWTIERLVGEGDDPTLRMSSSTEAGSASFLVSGFKAVSTITAGVLILLYYPDPAVENTRLVMLVLGGLLLSHWIVEKEEREDA